MPVSFPTAWLLFVLPIGACAMIALIRPLRALSVRYNELTSAIGLIGLVAFFAGLVGLLPHPWATVAVIAGGLAGGFTFFWADPHRGNGEGGSDEDGWRRGHHAPQEPPRPRGGGGTLDWERFDQLRAEWERAMRSDAPMS
jgi:hypothetical protein